jgi:hypothetical protein
MAQEAARDARLQQQLGNRTDLAEMRLAAQGGGRAGTSGGGGKGVSMGADEVMGEGFTKASALAAAKTTDPALRQAMEVVTNPNAVRARGANQYMADDEFKPIFDNAINILSSVNDHFARTQSDWKDRNDGDTSRNNHVISQGFLGGELSKDRADAAVGMNVGKPLTEPKDLTYQKDNDFTRQIDIWVGRLSKVEERRDKSTSSADIKEAGEEAAAIKAKIAELEKQKLASMQNPSSPQFKQAPGAGSSLPPPKVAAGKLPPLQRVTGHAQAK